MSEIHAKPWEPEEFIGSLWHSLVGKSEGGTVHHDCAVPLEAMRGRMGIILRGLGGEHSFAINEGTARKSTGRRSLLQRLGHVQELSLDAVTGPQELQLPGEIGLFDSRKLNEDYCLWLAVWAVDASEPETETDGLSRDCARLRSAYRTMTKALALVPGLQGSVVLMKHALLAGRKVVPGSNVENAVEQAVRHFLGDDSPLTGLAASVVAYCVAEMPGSLPPSPHDYTPYKSVPIWPDWHAPPPSAQSEGRDEGAAKCNSPEKSQRKRARRHKSDQANRRDPLILHRFETIKTWAEMLNLARRVDDEDEAQAKKAADDQEELGLSQAGKAPSTRLVFDLDLSPEDVHREQLSEALLYPEWDCRSKTYLINQARVLESIPDPVAAIEVLPLTATQQRTITHVRRMFEALLPQRAMVSGEPEGSEIDVEQTVRFATDRMAGQTGDDRLFRRLLSRERNLAIATLADVSRSTESVVDERQVIDTAKEALLALAHGLHAVGDRHAIYSFSSLRRERVFISRLKSFDEAVNGSVETAIQRLKPGHYTRLGPAIRHVASRIQREPSAKRLLLVITDGKPNDADYYEGRFGIEDTRRAVMEARMGGVAVFGITIDRKAESYIPHIFGRNGYAIVSQPGRLAHTLPAIYQHLVT